MIVQIPLKQFDNIEELVPAEWSEPRQERALFIIAYEVQGISESEFPGAIACDLKDVRVLFWKGELSHREEVKVTRFWVDQSGVFNVVEPEPTKIVKTPEALYSVFISPFAKREDTNTGEIEALRQIEIVRALFGSFRGRNIVFRKLYENTYSYRDKGLASWSEPLPVPLSFPRPVLTPDGFGPVLQAERSRWSLPEGERNRIDLSLRWLGQAMYESGVDSFLKYWFAIETLAIWDDTNIEPLNELLASVYSLPSAREAKERFHTGLLYGLRSRIVHRGLLVAVDGRILRYCEYLHHDVLRHRLSLPAEKRLDSLLAEGSFDYGAHLRSLLNMGAA